MADYQQIKLTRSGVSGTQPTSNDLELGELALNYADGKLYFKNDSNNIEQLNSTYNNSGQKIFVNEQDNHIGLNTISPEFLLDLGGSSAHTNNTLRLNQNDDGTAIRIGGSTAGDITLLRVDNADGESNSAQNGFSLKYIGSSATNNDALSIFSDNQTGAAVQALTVLQDGKVGINTPTPSAELDVTGDVEVSGTINSNAVTTTDITATGVVDLTIGTINIAAGAVTPSKLSTGAPNWSTDGALTTGAIFTDGEAVEVNYWGSGDRNAYIDFHSQGAVGDNDYDYDARLFRYPGVDGKFELSNKGTGPITVAREIAEITDDKSIATKEYVDSFKGIKNVVQTHTTARTNYTIPSSANSVNGAGGIELTDLTTRITLSTNNPEIIIQCRISYEVSENGGFNIYRRLVKDVSEDTNPGTETELGISVADRTDVGYRGVYFNPFTYDANNSTTPANSTLLFVDDLSGHTAGDVVEYVIKAAGAGQNFNLNHTIDNANYQSREYGSSTCVLQELGYNV